MEISFLYRTSRQFMSLRAAALGFPWHHPPGQVWRRGNLPWSKNSPDNRRLLREDRSRNDICKVMKISPLRVGFDTALAFGASVRGACSAATQPTEYDRKHD